MLRSTPHVHGRRRILAAGTAALAALSANTSKAAATGAPAPASAISEALESAMRAWSGGRDWQSGRLDVQVPEIVDNGLDVSLSVRLAGALPPGVCLLRLSVWAPRNPEPLVFEAEFDPAGLAAPELATRIRLATSQTLQALAEFSDGRVVRAERPVLVALAACIEG